jgi:fluoroacetyl-CoA thioesterase
MPLTAGLTAETDVVVEDHLTADRMGNPGFKVLSTPALVQLFEAASIQAIAPHQDVPLTGSVGTRIEVEHIAATPIGIDVRCTGRVEVKAQ